MRGVAAAAAALALAAAAHAAVRPPAHVQVGAQEFRFVLSRASVPAGPVVVELVDYGQDPHDLRLQRAGGGRVYRTPIVEPGGVYDLRLSLRRGVYRLWCGVANHRELGMRAVLVVR